MPKGINKKGINSGWFKKGVRPSIKTEFKKGEHSSKKTEFKKGQNKGKKNYFYGKRFFRKSGVIWKVEEKWYKEIHRWIVNQLGKPIKCQNINCKYPKKTTKGVIIYKLHEFHWANLSGKYKKDIKDWAMLCSFCHNVYDKSKKRRETIIIKL